jgi:hypothetical protein
VDSSILNLLRLPPWDSRGPHGNGYCSDPMPRLTLFVGWIYWAAFVAFAQTSSLPIVSIYTTAPAVHEATNILFTVVRQYPASTSLTVRVSFAGTAQPGRDYVPNALTNSAVIIPSGRNEVIGRIPLIWDQEIEDTETLEVRLEPGEGYRVSEANTVIVSVLDVGLIFQPSRNPRIDLRDFTDLVVWQHELKFPIIALTNTAPIESVEVF